MQNRKLRLPATRGCHPRTHSGALQAERTQASLPTRSIPFSSELEVCNFPQQTAHLGQGLNGREGLTADGDAQLHTTPLGQLHVEGATARDDRLCVQTHVDVCETQGRRCRESQLPTHSRPAGRDCKVTAPTPSCFFYLTVEGTEAW